MNNFNIKKFALIFGIIFIVLITLVFISQTINFESFKGFTEVAEKVKNKNKPTEFKEDIPMEKNMMDIGPVKFTINNGKLTTNVYMYMIVEFKNKKFVNGKDIPEIKTILLELLREQGVDDIRKVKDLKRKLVERLNRKKYKGAVKNIYITRLLTKTK